MGNVPAAPSRGEWVDDTLTFESSSPQGKGRYTYRFEGDDGYHFRLENSFDGGKTYNLMMEGTYRRKEVTPGATRRHAAPPPRPDPRDDRFCNVAGAPKTPRTLAQLDTA